MKIATIHRNEHANNWIVLIRDTVKETRTERTADDLAEAEQIAEAEGAQRTKVMLA